MPRPTKPPRTGQGAIAFGRVNHPVSYEVRVLEGAGRRTAKGGVTGEPDIMRQAFRAGRVTLRLDDGVSLSVTIVAHAEGQATAFFEGVVA